MHNFTAKIMTIRNFHWILLQCERVPNLSPFTRLQLKN